MEHLPLPSNPTLAPLKIPFLGDDGYDGGELASYPARHGWELSKDGGRDSFIRKGKSATESEIASFLQTWLYFGLLQTTLGSVWTPASRRSFIEQSPGGDKWLTSRSLQGLVADWAGYVAEVTTGLRWQVRLRIYWKRKLRRSISWLRARAGLAVTPYQDEIQLQYDKFCENVKLVQSVLLFTQRAAPKALHTDQVLALTALGMFLTSTWIRIYQSFYNKNPAELASLEVGKYITSAFLREHMARMNWCPSDRSRIFGKSSSSVIWYYANMQPPRKDKIHTSCTETFCERCRTDPIGVYKLSHREENCQCKLVEVEAADLRQVLVGMGIPVLSLDNKAEEHSDKFEVLDGNTSEFVAISHVWAEGLGNKEDNALQSCEVTRLFSMIGKLPVSKAQARCLWIDTLCVPVEVRDKDLHKLAMNRMKDTYKLAAEVLVLDNYLQTFKFKGISALELFSRVANCSWMHRIWTLQEGRLAKRVFFQFADGPLELGVIYNAIPLHSFPARGDLAVSSQVTMSYVASKYHTSEQVQAITDVLYEGLLATRDAFMFRDASKSSDEPFCLATILDLDEKRIIDAHVDKKMEALWEMIPKVPVSLVFSKAPSKLATPGFHWAPKSFRGPLLDQHHDWWSGPDHLWKKVEAVPTHAGLLARLPGVFLQPIKTGLGGWSNALDLRPNHAFRLSDGRWLGVCLGETWNDHRQGILPQSSPERMALILEDDSLVKNLDQQFTKSEIIVRDIPSRSNVAGVIASIVDVKNSCADSGRVRELRVNGIQHVQVIELPPEVSAVFGAAVTAAHMLWDRLQPGLPLGKEVVQVCITVVKEVMLDDKVVTACREQRRGAGADDSDEEIMYMLCGMAHAVYLAGFNSAELIPEDCQWYID